MSQQPLDPTRRFSNRVADYVRYRPSYPDEIVTTLQQEAGLHPGAVVADIGSGTGISSELFLRHGLEVYAVEPNPEMRAAAEDWLGSETGFHSVAGTAECSTLPDSWVDLVSAGQAFHWFDCQAARRELARVLRTAESYVALFWNSRRTDASPFLAAYEELLLEFSTDYREVTQRNIGGDQLRAFFGGDYRSRVCQTEQEFDFEGLTGRLLSSSYAPAAGDRNHEPMLTRLREIFDRHQQGGRVGFLYDTELHYGQIV
ncbi:MAG: class I SAM-dependent methyltransferase [Gemmatimonadetes bacterium]|nr:class I SAM-dependent methyltransferase [Gemmatimonadota bacterium]